MIYFRSIESVNVAENVIFSVPFLYKIKLRLNKWGSGVSIAPVSLTHSTGCRPS